MREGQLKVIQQWVCPICMTVYGDKDSAEECLSRGYDDMEDLPPRGLILSTTYHERPDQHFVGVCTGEVKHWKHYTTINWWWFRGNGMGDDYPKEKMGRDDVLRGSIRAWRRYRNTVTDCPAFERAVRACLAEGVTPLVLVEGEAVKWEAPNRGAADAQADSPR